MCKTERGKGYGKGGEVKGRGREENVYSTNREGWMVRGVLLGRALAECD